MLLLYNILNKYCISQPCWVTNNPHPLQSQRLTTTNLYLSKEGLQVSPAPCVFLFCNPGRRISPSLGYVILMAEGKEQESKLNYAPVFKACATHLGVTSLTFQRSEKFTHLSVALVLRTLPTYQEAGQGRVYNLPTGKEWIIVNNKIICHNPITSDYSSVSQVCLAIKSPWDQNRETWVPIQSY